MKSFLCPALCAAALCLHMLTGCEDPDARERATGANNQINELKRQLDDAKKSNDAATASIAEVEKRLMKLVNDRMDKLQDDLAANHKKLLDQMSQDAKTVRESANGLAESARTDNAKELSAAKAMVAENMQNIRSEMTTELDKLRKFMDNQLKELYPYAYQPRRVDPNAPPSDSATPAPKKAGDAAPEQK